MRHCKKCSLLFEEPIKICRSCGAILEEVAGDIETSPDTMVDDWLQGDTAEAGPLLSPIQKAMTEDRRDPAEWLCPTCGETVPAGFDSCWNCRTAQSGGEEPGIDDDPTNAIGERVALRCPACGSEKVIPDVHVCDQGQHSGGQLVVVVYGDPDALLFKDRQYGSVTADICGECGHMSLRAGNPGLLYERYLRSLE